MKLTKKKILLAVVCTCSIALSMWAAFLIAERFFFDKFFYHKSITYGYQVPGKNITYVDFGERTEDLLQLDRDYEYSSTREDVLGVQDDAETYIIAVIGDSFVWGQGVRFEDTVSQRLESKLNQHKKTTVLSLGVGGDSILDYVMRFDKVKQTYPVDLYIFVLVDNDSLLVRGYKEKYEQTSIFRDCQGRFPDEKPVYDLPPEVRDDQYDVDSTKRSDEYWSKWLANTKLSWTSKFNLCILDQSLKALPTDNAIYFVSQHHSEDDNLGWNTYIEHLEGNQKRVMALTDTRVISEYKSYWEDPLKYFIVSPNDWHPSKLAHRMFADILGKEILTNSKWGW